MLDFKLFFQPEFFKKYAQNTEMTSAHRTFNISFVYI